MLHPGHLLSALAAAQQRRANSFAVLTGWCLRYDVPLEEAVDVILPTRKWRLLIWVLGNPILGGVWVVFFGARARFHAALRRVVQDQRMGLPMADCLQHLRRWLPRAYLAGLADAERRGTLQEELPHLALLLRDTQLDRQPLRFALGVAAMRVLTILALLAALIVFQLPRLARTLSEMNGPSQMFTGLMEGVWVVIYQVSVAVGLGVYALGLPAALVAGKLADLLYRQDMIYLFREVDYIASAAFVCIFLYELWLLGALYRWVTRWRWVRGVAETVWLGLPVFGAATRRQWALEWVLAMRSALAAGQDWAAAASRYADTCQSWWFRPRVQRFASAVQAGVRWDQAWQAARLSPPALDWVVALGARREQPADVMATLESLLRDQLDLIVRRGEYWIELGTTLLCALLVGLIAWIIFHQLGTMAETIMDWPAS